jgi:protein-S-isoprenylcysteine O-methyltransferase Ste14
MNTIRHGLAVLMLISVPIALGLWYAIHPFARAWRRVGAIGTYGILAVPSFLLGAAVWRSRDILLGADLGAQPLLLAVAAVAAVAGAAIARQRRRHLNQRILAGFPELSRTDRGRLLTEGIYAKTRNPRYLEFLLFVLAYVSVADYAGTWALWILSFPLTHGIVLLEERELRDRFGVEYEEYCRRVPRYLPLRAAGSRRSTS